MPTEQKLKVSKAKNTKDGRRLFS